MKETMNREGRALVSKALLFAIQKHKNQKDDEGNDYFLSHLNPVMELSMVLTQDPEIVASAVLHDTLEDTDTTYDELVKEFGTRIADLVNEVTHEGKADHIGFYFPRLKSKEAIMIKFLDRASNISRMDSWDQKRQEHYLNHSKFWRGKLNEN